MTETPDREQTTDRVAELQAQVETGVAKLVKGQHGQLAGRGLEVPSLQPKAQVGAWALGSLPHPRSRQGRGYSGTKGPPLIRAYHTDGRPMDPMSFNRSVP